MTSKFTHDKIESLLNKYHALKKRDPMDLSVDQDLSIAIMNLISIEEHLFFTGAKTGKDEYFNLLTEVRNMRKELLRKIIVTYEGEVWCTGKHLLAASYRLLEVGTKLLDYKNKQEAYAYFTKAYNLYSLFWGVVLKILPQPDLPNTAIEKQQATSMVQQPTDHSLMTKLGVLVRKVLNCCIE